MWARPARRSTLHANLCPDHTQSIMRNENQKGLNLEGNDISGEEYREYDFGGRVYRIEDPVRLWCRSGGTTHRVLDRDGLVHCLPAPGHFGCILRWKPRDIDTPVAF